MATTEMERERERERGMRGRKKFERRYLEWGRGRERERERERGREVNEKSRGWRSQRGCLPFITAGYPLMESSCPHLPTVLPRLTVVISVLPNNEKSFVPRAAPFRYTSDELLLVPDLDFLSFLFYLSVQLASRL